MSPEPKAPGADLAALRRRLAGTRGRVYWRSLEEVARSPSFLAWLEGEFPGLVGAIDPGLDRRRFLQVMAASFAFAGLAGCGPEPETRYLVPQVEAPEGIVPGVPRHFATATMLDGFAEGVIVKHVDGRPIKIEGNPQHPASLGATSPWGQASILGLYDPDRSQAVIRAGGSSTWERFSSLILERREQWQRDGGKGLRLLTGTMTSPSFAAQIAELRRRYPEARWHQWDAANRDAAQSGAMIAYGRPLDILLDLDKADVILAVESDMLSSAPGHLRYARHFAARRRAAEVGARMSRVYAIESAPTLAGSMADHHFLLRPEEIVMTLFAIAGALHALPDQGYGAAAPPWAAAVARDLQQHRGAALVHVGGDQPAIAHALAHLINDSLAAPGATLRHIDPVALEAGDQLGALTDLVSAMNAGAVDTLFILGANPVFTVPADLGFAEALKRVHISVHLGEYFDETAAACQWHVPETHEYEAWSDARAFDGTATILQPQVRATHSRRSVHEIMGLLLGQLSPDAYQIVRGYWQGEAEKPGEADFASFWTQSVRDGLVAGSSAKPVEATTLPDLGARLRPPLSARSQAPTILFRPDAAVWDGRFANNGWLQEMPRPHTTLTWDNAAIMSPATASRFGLADENVIELRDDQNTLHAPVLVLPGIAPDCVLLPFGEGRSKGGAVGVGVGFDAYLLRRSDGLRQRSGVSLRKIEGKWRLALRQHHQMMAGRPIVRTGDLDSFLRDAEFLHKEEAEERKRHGEVEASLYPRRAYDGNAWAMAISLDSCIGCGACVLACQAENNLAVVGKEEVLRGHEMHWLRVDRYYSGSPDDPETLFQPVPCMHCEDAPCEVVCPVQATVHDSDGLNLMVYNRCVGTRFCSNNCPYKVRRFNFFDFTAKDPRPRESWNPDVTVRARGVMEKCTYCIQRIREAKILADRENRPIREGEVKTACQQACPTEAIVFGDKNDEASAVSKRKASPLDYALLDGLNTRPRTTYAARLYNRNPELAEG